MCLSIDKSFKRRPPKRALTVFKIYRSFNGTGHFESPYRRCNYSRESLEPGKLITSSRGHVKLTDWEKSTCQVLEGLHAFRFLKDARLFVSLNIVRGVKDKWHYCIIKMRGAPKDFVARGKFEGLDSIVFKRLRVQGPCQFLKTSAYKSAPVL
jgi:hypothetical protein